MRNDIPIYTDLDGNDRVSNFKMSEFENRDGIVCIHSSVPRSLELTRQNLQGYRGGIVRVILTDAIRTFADLEHLAAIYGWIDEGGTVARDSKHLLKHGGIAVDIKAQWLNPDTRRWNRVPQKTVGEIARRFFDWVKDDYGDGHVHADNRNHI